MVRHVGGHVTTQFLVTLTYPVFIGLLCQVVGKRESDQEKEWLMCVAMSQVAGKRESDQEEAQEWLMCVPMSQVAGKRESDQEEAQEWLMCVAMSQVAGKRESDQVAGKRESDQEKEAQEWIEKVVGERFPPGEPYEHALRNGVILCKLMNKLQPGLVPKINSSGGDYKMMDNLSQ
uniref:Calponin-homology (CH) domain-containing protein n=1 Tax=Timema bartmani TaxID=61472 RepID=A0A7R9EXX2_9NEOP|nr:unnamed protein product [Timema bartmani]